MSKPASAPGRLSCQDSFEQACDCLHKVNDLLADARQPYEFKIVSDLDPFRIALCDRASGNDNGDVMYGDRDFAALMPQQAAHLRDVFLTVGFRAHTVQLWEHIDFSSSQSCHDLYLREEAPQNVRLFLHGLTRDIIDAARDRLKAAFHMMPRMG